MVSANFPSHRNSGRGNCGDESTVEQYLRARRALRVRPQCLFGVATARDRNDFVNRIEMTLMAANAATLDKYAIVGGRVTRDAIAADLTDGNGGDGMAAGQGENVEQTAFGPKNITTEKQLGEQRGSRQDIAEASGKAGTTFGNPETTAKTSDTSASEVDEEKSVTKTE